MSNTSEVQFHYTQYSVNDHLLIKSREGTNDYFSKNCMYFSLLNVNYTQAFIYSSASKVLVPPFIYM